MTTRSGRKYTSVVTQPQGETADMGNTAESIAALQELFKSLLDERKRREEEEARRREQERLEREEERKQLEAQWEKERQEHLAEKERERQRREEDLRRRDKELQAHMKLLSSSLRRRTRHPQQAAVLWTMQELCTTRNSVLKMTLDSTSQELHTADPALVCSSPYPS